jgi:hypothetical protein
LLRFIGHAHILGCGNRRGRGYGVLSLHRHLRTGGIIALILPNSKCGRRRTQDYSNATVLWLAIIGTGRPNAE